MQEKPSTAGRPTDNVPPSHAPLPGADRHEPPIRFAPDLPLPPYAYVPGHGLPHPVNDPRGHLHAARAETDAPAHGADTHAALHPDPVARRRAVAALLAADRRWLFALDLFNAGYYWEAHEAWEALWIALGRSTPEARFIQGLIHVAAAGVKIREGTRAGVERHTRRARALLDELRPAADAGPGAPRAEALGLAPESIAVVLAELEHHRPACWHTSRCPVVKVLAAELRVER